MASLGSRHAAACFLAGALALARSSAASPSSSGHEIGATLTGGVGLTENDWYDRTKETVWAWGAGAEYAYRTSGHLRFGVEGARTGYSSRHALYGALWTAMPFVGISFGSKVQFGLRAGFGFAYGGRAPAPRAGDREGAGVVGEGSAEVAFASERADVFARLGLRAAKTWWSSDDPLHPNDFPVAYPFLSLGARWKL